MYFTDNREYFLIKYKDGYQELLCTERYNPNNFEDAKIVKYDKFKFEGDTVIEPNRLIHVQDSIIIGYSTKENQSNYFQFNRFGLEGMFGEEFPYAVKGILEGNKTFENSKITDVFLGEIYKDLFNLDFYSDIARNTFSVEKDLLFYLDISAEIYDSYLRSRIFFDIKNLGGVYPNFDYNHLVKYHNEKPVFIHLFKNYIDPKRDTIFRNLVIKEDRGLSDFEFTYIVEEIDKEGEYISDIFEINGSLFFLFKESSTGDVFTYYSNDEGETWSNKISPELKNSNTLEFVEYNNQIYAYNKDNIFVTYIVSSVESEKEINSIKCYANNSALYLKSNGVGIKQVTLIDVIGTEIFKGNFTNQIDLKIPLDLSNQNLLICKIQTEEGIIINKIIKGEN